MSKPFESRFIFRFWGVIKNSQKPSKTLRVYIYSWFLMGYPAPPKTIKKRKNLFESTVISRSWGVIKKPVINPLQLSSFFEGYLAPPKTIKKCQKPLESTVISRCRDKLIGIGLESTHNSLSKTVKNSKKPWSVKLFSLFEGYIAPPKTIKNVNNL